MCLGLHSWAIYTLVAVMMGLSRHILRLPMSFKSCFYPMLGSRTFGWLGDFIDACAVSAVMVGSSIALAIACKQLWAGMTHILDHVEGPKWKYEARLF